MVDMWRTESIWFHANNNGTERWLRQPDIKKNNHKPSKKYTTLKGKMNVWKNNLKPTHTFPTFSCACFQRTHPTAAKISAFSLVFKDLPSVTTWSLNTLTHTVLIYNRKWDIWKVVFRSFLFLLTPYDMSHSINCTWMTVQMVNTQQYYGLVKSTVVHCVLREKSRHQGLLFRTISVIVVKMMSN